MRIVITNEQNFVPVDEAKIRKAISLLPWGNRKMRLSVVYINDAEIAQLNERYLKHQGPTDVLSFPISEQEGEIVVSAETALEESKARGIEAEGELILYTVHGVLHLIGYDDKDPTEAAKMHAVEKEVITQMGYRWDWD